MKEMAIMNNILVNIIQSFKGLLGKKGDASTVKRIRKPLEVSVSETAQKLINSWIEVSTLKSIEKQKAMASWASILIEMLLVIICVTVATIVILLSWLAKPINRTVANA